MLTRPQFVTALNNVARFIYLGGPARFRTQSSMLPVVNAVAAFSALQNGANMLAVIQAIGNVPVGKKLKYAQALNALYNSFPNPIYVTVNPFTLHLVMAQGIGVIRSNLRPSHQTDAILALLELEGLGTGHTLLDNLCQQVAAGKRVGIRDAVGTASGGNECAIIAGMPDDYRSQLQVALSSGQGVGAQIGAAMTALGHPPIAPANASFIWLQNQINISPIYQLLGPPSVIPSSNVHGMNWISAATLIAWVNGLVQFPAPLVGQQQVDAQLVLGTVLQPGATPNAGGHTVVRWNASNLTAAGLPRPPYIGLGHELIHALHNQRGEQPGNENGMPDTALYEFLCVGLGPFGALAITENTLRAAAPGVAPRAVYG